MVTVWAPMRRRGFGSLMVGTEPVSRTRKLEPGVGRALFLRGALAAAGSSTDHDLFEILVWVDCIASNWRRGGNGRI
jgi:hypothetical protein